MRFLKIISMKKLKNEIQIKNTNNKKTEKNS